MNLFFKKFMSIVLGIVLLAQSFVPYTAFLAPSIARAEEITPTDTITPSPTPTDEITPTATPTPDEVTITPTDIPTETVTPTPDETTTTQVPADDTGTEVQTLEPTGLSPPDSSQESEESKTTGNEDLSIVVLGSISVESLNLGSQNQTQSATLTTDKPDYSPTDTAFITGSGLLSNTDYVLRVWSDDEPATSTEVNVTSNENGTFTYAYQLDGTYRPNYSAELKDSEGNVVASVTFTDANPSADLEQCHNDGGAGTFADCKDPSSPTNTWGSGNAGSGTARLYEGNSQNYRLVMKNMPIGTEVTILIGQQFTKGGKMAYDFPTGPGNLGTATTPIGLAGIFPCDDNSGGILVSPCPHTIPSTMAAGNKLLISTIPSGTIPDATVDGQVIANQTAYYGTSESTPPTRSPQYMYVYGATPGSFVGYTFNGTAANVAGGDTDLNWSFKITPTSSDVVVAWGAHISKNGTYGAKGTAVSISGSPYHTFLNGWSLSNLGQQDMQMSAGAVIPFSTLTINKTTIGGDDTFNYSTTGGNDLPTTFPITTTNGSGSKSYNTIIPGTYSVTEDTLSGWGLSNLTCPTVTGTGTSATVDLANRKVNITIGAAGGGNVVCTFTNTKDSGSIKVNKLLDSDANGSFETSNPVAFTWSLDGNGTNTMGSTVSNLSTGSHNVSENSVTNYHFVGWFPTGSTQYSCSNPQGNTLPVSVNVVNNQTTEITLCNARNTGTIELKKVWSGTGGQTTLNIGTTAGGSDVDTQLTGAAGAAPLTTGSNTVPTGTYYVSETGGLSNYSSVLACTDNGDAVTPGQNNSLSVTTGHAVVCTFTNTRDTGTLRVLKNVDLNGDGDYTDANETGNTTWVWQANGGSNHNTGDSAITVNTGDYQLSETPQTNFHFVSLSCTGGALNTSTNTVTVNKDANVVCTFTNARNTGTIELKKVWSGTGGQTTLNIGTTAGGSDVDTQLTGVAGAAPLTTGSNTVPTGTYYVSETGGLTNYTSSLACTDNGQSIDPGANNSVSVTTGHAVVCTFTNTRNTGTVIVKKVMVGGTDTFSFTGTPNGSIDTNNGTIQSTIDTGSYTSTESTKAGWDLTSVVCNDGTSTVPSTGDVQTRTATFNVEANETVTCTFTNTKRGHIVVDKVTSPSQSSQSFDFTTTGTGYNGFSLTDQATPNDQEVVPGSYTVSEGAVSGWDSDGGVCDNGETPASLDVQAGETVTCTFTNTQRGSISGFKFEDIDGDIINTLEYLQNPVQGLVVELWKWVTNSFINTGLTDTTDANGFYEFLNVVPGVYQVREVLSSLGAAWTNLTSTSVDVTLDAGEDDDENNFINTQYGKIIIVKQTLPDGNQQSFDFDLSYGDNDADLSDGQQDDSGNLLPGTYSVSENVPAGWDLTSATCSDGSNPGSIALASGETVTCTFTNTQRGTIIVKKHMVGGTSSFDFTGDVQGAIDTNDETISTSDVVPGTYTSVEGTKTGWALTNISCNDTTNGGTASTGNVNTRAATFNVEPGETVMCTFTNNKPAAQIDLTPLRATNKIGDNHVVTANVQVQNGDGNWGPAADGTTVTFSLLNNSANAAFVGGNTCNTTNGTCSITINSTQTGSVDIHATASPALLGVTLVATTGTGGENSADAQKDYVNARISITPLSDTNEVNDDHNFTVTVEQNTGSGWVPVPAGTLANAIVTPSTTIDASDCTNGVNASGQCTVTVNSGSAGIFTIIARSTVVIGGVTFKLQTNGQGENSDPAQKTYVDASLALSPQEATNEVNDPHTITAHVTKNTGSGVTNAEGVTVTFSITSGTANFVGNDNDCVTDAVGECSVQIVDDTPGANTIDAITTFSVGGISLTRSTNGNSGPDGTDSAEKTYQGGKIIVRKITVGGDDKFNFNTNYSDDFKLSDDQSNDSGFLPTGTYNVSEDQLSGWDSDGGVCDNQQTPDEIVLGAGDTVTCTFTNTKRGNVVVVKYNDLNGNGDIDEGEEVLNDWEMHLVGNDVNSYQFTGNGNPAVDGQVTFSDLVPGNFTLNEQIKKGWEQTNIICGRQEGYDSEGKTFDLTLNPGQTVTCQILNHNIIPKLTISKVNNAVGDKALGDIVTYTITVKADEEFGPAENVKVTDLLPDGFHYNSGSWQALYNGVLNGNGVISEPTYASPGVWTLGHMDPGDVYTLIYTATIGAGTQPGTYYDNAWAQGTPVGDESNTILALAVDPGDLDNGDSDSKFVGTQVSIVNENPGGPEHNITRIQEVLGAVLPATGENTIWVVLATLLFGAGAASIFVSLKLRRKNVK